MPRTARIHSVSGIYHVMLRGINRQQIFEDQEDNRFYLDLLEEYKNICGYKIFAYCLMGNHLHLLIKEGDDSLERIFKCVGTRFVYWYNAKYKRTGHLFQDRFKSEAVESLRYLGVVIAYIHQNPVKAGICSSPEEYCYSSFSEYLGQPRLVDMDFVEQYISMEAVIDLSRRQIGEKCLEIADVPIHRVTDEQAKQIMKGIIGRDNAAAFQTLVPEERDRCLRKLRQSGMSIRQICRLTGASYYLVQKCTNQSGINQRTVP